MTVFAGGRRRATTRVMRRSVRRGIAAVLVATTAGLLAGCTPASERSPSPMTHSGPPPTAMTIEDGVEVWDLTVPPSAEAFGIAERDDPVSSFAVGGYSSHGGGGRPVRFELPGDRTVDLRAHDVVFQLNDSPEGVTDPRTGEVLVPEGRRYSLRVSTPALEGAEAGQAGYEEALAELGLPGDSARELQQEIADAPNASPLDVGRVGASAELPSEKGMTFGVSSSFRPDPDPDRQVFLLEYSAVWDVLPIP